MKHAHAFLRKEFSKIRDEITRNYVLNTLTKSDEELQQLKQKGQDSIWIDEILEENQT